MDRPSSLVPLLSIVVALALAAFAVTTAFVPSLVPQLPWAGALAGLLAILQAVNLRNALPVVRGILAFAGAAAVVLMLIVQTLRT